MSIPTTDREPKADRRGEGRLSVDDWIRAAFQIMAEEGIGGVKILKLCRILGVTKGSFYWHFSDLEAFLDELTNQWREGHWISHTLMGSPGSPDDSMLRAMKLFVDPRVSGIDRSMREWARTDVRARDAIAESDARIFDYVHRCFQRIGFDADEADLRAKILFYSGIGYGVTGPIGSRDHVTRQLEAMVALLTKKSEL